MNEKIGVYRTALINIDHTYLWEMLLKSLNSVLKNFIKTIYSTFYQATLLYSKFWIRLKNIKKISKFSI